MDATQDAVAAGGRQTAGALAAHVISRSHARSRDFGLDPRFEPSYDALAADALSALVEQNRALRSHAAPVMEALYGNIVDTESMVLLTDAQGVILHALGDAGFLRRARRVALAPGVCWSERSKGTNAIGTALVEAAPTVVHAHEHFLQVNHFLTCSATPIFAPDGTAIGVLDVTGDSRGYHRHTMALVRMSAQLIENQLFDDLGAQAVRVRFHAREEFIGTLMEGIAAFDPEGRLLACNRAAMFQLGAPAHALRGLECEALFGVTVAQVCAHARGAGTSPLSVRLANGLMVALRTDGRAEAHAPTRAGASTSGAASRDVADGTRAHRPGPGAVGALAALDTGDPQVAKAVAQVRRVIGPAIGRTRGRDIPIIIVGETGTGKEWLARAIHRDSPRADKPFVAVDCASIPEALIESELFGYEDGAFTGARKRGRQGRIAAAHGGTLFLDEIGDMPPALQTRLLRVLQERAVTPLGASASVPVDVVVVCATHRNLRERIACDAFREDLFYRLNGLRVTLPPLRERRDLAALVRRVLVEACADEPPPEVAPDVMRAFERHRWPGNLRELANVLRTACAMAGSRGAIGMDDLPDDFLEVLAAGAPRAADAEAVPTMHDATDDRATVGGHATEPPHASDTPQASGRPLADVERDTIARVLREQRGNVSAAARVLGVSRNTLYRRLDRTDGPPHARATRA